MYVYVELSSSYSCLNSRSADKAGATQTARSWCSCPDKHVHHTHTSARCAGRHTARLD
jgi:hypothetical protein